jgi:hypothetical protein
VVENLVFLFEDDNYKEFLKKDDFRKDTLLICKNHETVENLSKIGFNVKIINEYKLSDDQIIKPIKWIKSWSSKKIFVDGSFKELFSYEGISLFWYLESRLFHKRIHGLITLIEQVKNILSKENPNKVWIFGDLDLIHIVKSLHGNVYFEKTSKVTKSTISEKNYSGFLVWKLMVLKVFRGFIIPRKIFRDKINPIIFVTEIGSWRLVYDELIGKSQYGDVYFHKIITKLKEKEEPIEIIDFENNLKRLLKSYFINKKRIASLGISIQPWEKFLSFKSILKCRKAYKIHKEKWKMIKNTAIFQESLLVDGISTYELLVNDFEELFNSFKAIASMAMIEASKKIIDVKKPSELVMIDEYGALQISLLYIAKNMHIPSLALQHGVIYDDAFAYTHNIEDFNNKKSELNFVLPDKMCVWSERSKNALINSAKFYPDSIIVTGDPKTDNFESLKKYSKHEKIFHELKIPKDKKIILFATENLPNLKEMELVAKTVLKTVSEMTEFFLLIKLHPNEFDSFLYQKIVNELNIKSYLILKDVNLYEIIQVSDLVIISYSTVGLEAMRMSKPVIALNLMGLHNESVIIKNNSELEIKNINELITSIMQFTKNPNNQKIEEYKNFAEQEIGKITGNAAEKITQEILKLKNKKQEN